MSLFKSLNTKDNLKQICAIKHLDIYLAKFIDDNTNINDNVKFYFYDSSCSYTCTISNSKKDNNQYNLHIYITQTCFGKEYSPYELTYNFTNILELFENEYLDQASEYSMFKEKYEYYINHPEEIDNIPDYI
jgi:hypothetical protein